MTTTTISQRQVSALAALVHEARNEWDEPGIAAALRKCPPLPLSQLVIAAMRYAEDRNNTTPAHIGDLSNRAWDTDWYPPCPTHPEQRARRTNGECASCFADRTEAGARPARLPTPPPAPLRQLAAQARAELDAVREKAGADG